MSKNHDGRINQIIGFLFKNDTLEGWNRSEMKLMLGWSQPTVDRYLDIAVERGQICRAVIGRDHRHWISPGTKFTMLGI